MMKVILVVLMVVATGFCQLHPRTVCPKVQKYTTYACQGQDRCDSDSDCNKVSGELCCPTENQCYLSCQKAVKPAVYQCPVAIDLAILVDSSGSIGRGNWRKEKSLVKDIINHYDISESGTHVAIISYSTNAVVEIKFNTYTGAQLNAVNMNRSIDQQLVYRRGFTRFDKALITAKKTVFNGTRRGVPKVCILITDGQQTQPAMWLNPSQPLKDQGVDVYSLGIGSDFNVLELLQVASSPDNVFSSTWDSLSHAAFGITKQQCGGAMVLPKPKVQKKIPRTEAALLVHKRKMRSQFI